MWSILSFTIGERKPSMPGVLKFIKDSIAAPLFHGLPLVSQCSNSICYPFVLKGLLPFRAETFATETTNSSYLLVLPFLANGLLPKEYALIQFWRWNPTLDVDGAISSFLQMVLRQSTFLQNIPLSSPVTKWERKLSDFCLFRCWT